MHKVLSDWVALGWFLELCRSQGRWGGRKGRSRWGEKFGIQCAPSSPASTFVCTVYQRLWGWNFPLVLRVCVRVCICVCLLYLLVVVSSRLFPLHQTPCGDVLKKGDLTDGFPSGVPWTRHRFLLWHWRLCTILWVQLWARGLQADPVSLSGRFQRDPGASVTACAQEAPTAVPASHFRQLLPSVLLGWWLASGSGSVAAAAGLVLSAVPPFFWLGSWAGKGEKGERGTQEKKT